MHVEVTQRDVEIKKRQLVISPDSNLIVLTLEREQKDKQKFRGIVIYPAITAYEFGEEIIINQHDYVPYQGKVTLFNE